MFTKAATASKFDQEALLNHGFDPDIRLIRKDGDWYLELSMDPAWASGQARSLVTSERLGKAVIPDLPFVHPDGTPVRLDTDYFNRPRNAANPFPGPVEISGAARHVLRVWPRQP